VNAGRGSGHAGGRTGAYARSMHTLTHSGSRSSSRSARTRRLGLALALAVLLTPVAFSLGVAELTVTAYGAQRLDLATGFTELPDGGEVVDRGTGVRLSAPWLRYAEGELLEARDAIVDGPFGRLEAPWVTVDLEGARLEASGGVALEDEGGGVIRAGRLLFDAADGWAVAQDGVSGEAPAFGAEVVWAHVESGRLVLVAPYHYEDGPVRLRSDSPDARLQLTPIRDADGFAGYDASTTLDDDVALRLEAGVE
jgi:hypothetical protein